MEVPQRQVVRKPLPHIVKQRPPAVKLYRRIAFSSVILTVLTIALVAYLSFVKAHIKIYAASKGVNTDFVVDIVKVSTAANQVEGKLIEKSYEKTEEFTPSAEGTTVPGKAGGEVILYNKYSQDQPLVATTRLLSTDGKLFRLNDSVTVPAGGEVKAMVSADEEGKDFEIGPGRFTIPGLWSGLQDQIYAESKSAMTGGEVTVIAVSEEDLDNAETALSEQMYEQIKAEMLDENVDPRFSRSAFTYIVEEKVSDTEPGEEKDKFTIKLVINVIGAFFNDQQMDDVIRAKLDESLGKDYLVGDISNENTMYSVNDYDMESGIANVLVEAEAEAMLRETSRVLDKQKITGLSVKDAEAYLIGSPLIEKVEITTRPFWIGRLPNLEDHIDYEIVQ